MFSQLFTCVPMNWGKMKLKTVWVSYLLILTETKFQTGLRFSCERNLPETKWISADSLDGAFKTQCGYRFHIGHFDRNEISFRVIKYRVNTTRNEIPTYPSEYRVILKCSRNETSCEQNLFSRQFEIANRYEFISPLIWASKKII